MTKILEKHIQRDVLHYLKLKKIYCFKLNNAGIYKKSTGSYIPSGIIGLPDIAAFIGGQVVFFEIKTARGVQSDGQKEFEKECKKNGIFYKVIRSLEEIMDYV